MQSAAMRRSGANDRRRRRCRGQRCGGVALMPDALHLGVALDGYGWHPHAWRTTLAADPATESVLSGRYWAGLAATAERGLLDFLTIDDTLMPQPGRREPISPRRLGGRGGARVV